LGSAGEGADNVGANGEVRDNAQSPEGEHTKEHTKFFVFEVLTVQDGYNGGRFRD
jgi:hypothetical protein